MKLFTWLGQFAQDIRFGARNLAKSPGFTATALASLTLGIGGSTAMYSVIYAVVLDPFPYKDVDRLLSVHIQDPGRRSNGSYYTIDQFLEIAERNSVFDGVIASTWSDVTWTGAGEPQRLRGNHCTMNTFTVMGIAPLIGRATASTDSAAEPVTILGYKFWQRQFGGDPTVLGRKLVLNGKVRTIVGVMPPRFMWRGADVYLPDVFRRGETVEGERTVHLLGRLKAGVTGPQVEANLRPIVQELQRRRPTDFAKDWRIKLMTFKETFPSGITDALWILFGAVGLLLLIACVNVSNLLLSKAAYRQREIAIRAAMGAGRLRIVSQLLAESLALGITGGLLGAAAAYAGVRGILAMAPPNTIPDEAQVSLNVSVLLFTLGVSVAAAILFGLAPAMHLSGSGIADRLKEAGRGVSGSARQRILRNALVAGEVAFSLMLLVGASLMIRTLTSMQRGNLGIPAGRVLTLRIPFSEQRYADAKRRNAFLQEVLRRVAAVPGVMAAGINSGLAPIYNRSAPIQVVGAAHEDNHAVLLQQTSENYLNAMGIPLAQGRFFNEQEVNAQFHRAAVNQAFVRRYLSEGDALGRIVRVPRLRSAPTNLDDDSFQIVGIVKDTINRIETRETVPELYIPYTVTGAADRLHLLAQGRPESLEKSVREQVYAVDRGQPVMEVRTVEAMLNDYVYARPRFNLLLFTVFAVLGLTLALFGVYGVIANAVSQQTREIGIRIALGATSRQVIGMVIKGGAKLLAIGIALGLAGSLASVRVLSGLVRNVSTFDPYSFVAVTLLLFAAGLLASFLPARRAARVDPVTALRNE